MKKLEGAAAFIHPLCSLVLNAGSNDHCAGLSLAQIDSFIVASATGLPELHTISVLKN